MKTVQKTSVMLGLAGVLGLANVALGQEALTANYTVLPLKNTSRVLFSCPKNNAAKMKVSIKDGEGQLLHTETLRGGADMARVYDLSNVQAKKFVFEVSADGQAANTREVTIKGMPETNLVMRVSAAGGEGFAHLSYFNNFDNATVHIRVTDAQGEEVHSSYTTSEDYYRFFDMSKLPAGKYTFVLTTGNQEVKETFELVK
jgi:hypothetical protein